MTKALHLSDDFRLPLDAVTQTFAILAKRRVGKTYTASVMAEEFVANDLPFVALDPTGAWWGLRSSADGKTNGLPVIIIGGAHGDVPLESTAGKVIADLVVEHPGFYVIDLSATASNAEQDRFATDFAERLYRRKERAHDPLHLFIDEADSFAPQRPMPGQLRMLGAFEALVRRGGIRGIGATFITQRPAVLNKNVLTQAECLIVLQVTAPQDQDAIDDWVKRNGTKEERDTLMASLASLQRGEAWFWSPGWLQTFRKVHVRERHTFNSSATPKAGEKTIIPSKLAPVDIDKLGKEIQSTIEKAKDNDPSALRRQIAELKKQVSAPAPKPERIEVPVFNAADDAMLRRVADSISSISDILRPILQKIPAVQAVRLRVKPVATHVIRTRVSTPTPLPRSDSNWTPNKCERTLLSVLAQFPSGCSRKKLILLAGYCWSGSTQNALGKLRSEGAVRGDNSGVIQITDAGLACGPFDPLPEGEELKAFWLTFPHFGKCERELLRCFFENPDGLTREQLLESSGYEWSGSTQNALGALRTAEVITGRNNEVMQLSEELLA